MKEKRGKEEARARKKRGGGRPGHGSWASRGVFRPKTSTNEVRNFLQLFVAIIAGCAALRLAKNEPSRCGPHVAVGSAGARRARCGGRNGPSGGIRPGARFGSSVAGSEPECAAMLALGATPAVAAGAG